MHVIGIFDSTIHTEKSKSIHGHRNKEFCLSIFGFHLIIFIPFSLRKWINPTSNGKSIDHIHLLWWCSFRFNVHGIHAMIIGRWIKCTFAHCLHWKRAKKRWPSAFISLYSVGIEMWKWMCFLWQAVAICCILAWQAKALNIRWVNCFATPSIWWIQLHYKVHHFCI